MKKKKPIRKAADSLVIKAIPVVFADPSNKPTIFANQMVVQHDRDNLYLIFYEMLPPLMVGGSEEDLERRVDELTSIQANCIAKVAIPASKMAAFSRAIAENVTRYQQKEFSTEDEEGVNGHGN